MLEHLRLEPVTIVHPLLFISSLSSHTVRCLGVQLWWWPLVVYHLVATEVVHHVQLEVARGRVNSQK